MALAAMLWVPIAVRKNEHIILTYSLVNFFFTHPLTDAAGPFVARRLGGGAAHLGSFSTTSIPLPIGARVSIDQLSFRDRKMQMARTVGFTLVTDPK